MEFKMIIEDLKNKIREFCLETDSSLIITNLKENSQASYYCLVIQQKAIQLARKENRLRSMIIFDVEENSISLNGESQSLSFLDTFQEEVLYIFEELKSNRAIIYKGRV